MIRLEIPVENEKNVISMSFDKDNIDDIIPQPTSPDAIPDLILSARNINQPRVCEQRSAQLQTSPQRSPCRVCRSVPATYSDYLQLPDKESSDIVLELDEVTLHANHSSPMSEKSDGSERSEPCPLVCKSKRESFRNSRAAEVTSQDNESRTFRNRRQLKREVSLDSLEVGFLNCENSTQKDETADSNRKNKDSNCSSEANSTEVSSQAAQRHFLRALNKEITRVANQPTRRHKYEAKGDEEETWC